MKIVVDGMGGDDAPAKIVDGVVLAVEQFTRDGLDHVVCITGDKARITEQLDKCEGSQFLGKQIEIHHTDDYIGMAESPSEVLKSKPRSSVHVGIEMLRSGTADGMIGMGNTGAVMAVALFGLGRIEGVSRPTIGAFFPTLEGETLLLDVGTNLDCKPNHLAQFALMGEVYAKHIQQIENPRIALLSVGEEEKKGDMLTVEVHQLLKQEDSIKFIGNVEGRDILVGGADVIVCDGFVGNVVLKLAESFKKVLTKKVKEHVAENPGDSDALRNFLKLRMEGFDYQDHGGVPLLGVDGVVIIGHGSSSAKAVKRAIFVAIEMVKQDINNKIKMKVKNY